jgi:hypothetical protein
MTQTVPLFLLFKMDGQQVLIHRRFLFMIWNHMKWNNIIYYWWLQNLELCTYVQNLNFTRPDIRFFSGEGREKQIYCPVVMKTDYFFCTSAKTRYHKWLKSQEVHFTGKSSRKTEMVNYQLYFTTTWRNVQ